jgi:hypothetical protein
VTELASLRRAPRAESLTLAPDRLHHDPGHHYCGDAYSIGPPRDIERVEVGSVQLEHEPGGRERLLLYVWSPVIPRLARLAGRAGGAPDVSPQTVNALAGASPTVEIGPCLRPADRAWLAGVLRAWFGAGAPQDAPSTAPVGEVRVDDLGHPLQEGG